MASKTSRRSTLRTVSVLLTLLITLSVALVQSAPRAVAAERATVALWNALVPLNSVNTFMNTGAHPDDERSAILAYMSRGVGARTISLIANRGEGGQNAIGGEYVTALGVVRSRELEEASKATNVELIMLGQELDDSIWDFGFSKTPEETLAIWGKDVTLERLVRAIRETRPDVIMPSFQDSHGQHGHHRAMTVLTLEAFKAAANPDAFPEQIKEGLRPWQIKKLYLPAESGGGGVYADSTDLEATVEIPVGDYDPMLGVSYVQLGEESRFYHKSQGMGRILPEGPSTDKLHLAQTVLNSRAQERSVFEGLPQTVGQLAYTVSDYDLQRALLEAQRQIDEAMRAYPRHKAVAESLQAALGQVKKARTLTPSVAMESEQKYDLDHRLAVKEQQLTAALAQASVVVARLQASQYELSRGGSATFTLTAFRGGPVEMKNVHLSLRVPEGWKLERVGTDEPVWALGNNQTAKATFKVTVPEGASYFHPYHPLDLHGVVSFESGGLPVQVTVQPEKRVAVLPDISIRTQPEGLVYNLLKPEPMTVNVVATNYKDGAAKATLAPVLPEGWKAEPAQAELSFQRRGQVQPATFTITPPASMTTAGQYSIAFATKGEARSESYVRVMEYPHIGRTYMVLPAKVDVQAFEVSVDPTLKVGYVASGLDSVPESLRQIGVNVDLLDSDDLAFGDLSGYDTIVIGIRAYRARPDLGPANSRLLEYVKQGGNLVVQYHLPSDGWNVNTSAPYMLKIGSPSFDWRVTDENSEVRLLAPDHTILNNPNEIQPSDWQGWIKDRGLYFPSEWGPEFTPILSMNDAGEKPLDGSLLVAKYGEGRYVYTSLILYYQMEQRVPGAFRLFANLISPEK